MPHSLIIGMTESGKTTLARQIALKYKNVKRQILVLDPLEDNKWPTNKIYTEPEEYLNIVFNSRQCGLFIDESGEMIGRYSGIMGKLATRSRHYGHNAHFIVQRATQIDKTVRDQCSTIYVFRVSKKDAQTLSDDYTDETLKEASSLNKGEFFMVSRFGKARKLCVKWY